jgi:hypothetical protein
MKLCCVSVVRGLLTTALFISRSYELDTLRKLRSGGIMWSRNIMPSRWDLGLDIHIYFTTKISSRWDFYILEIFRAT